MAQHDTNGDGLISHDDTPCCRWPVYLCALSETMYLAVLSILQLQAAGGGITTPIAAGLISHDNTLCFWPFIFSV
jgi:hypothetical protein